MNRQIFCSRKGGATANGRFFPIRTSMILTKQLERKFKKIEARNRK